MKRAIPGAEPGEGGQEPVANRPVVFAHRLEEVARRKNPPASDQADDLGPQRHERDQENEAQEPQEQPAGQRLARRHDVLAPEPARDPREQGPVSRHEAVAPLARGRETREVPVEPQRPAAPRSARQESEDRFGGLRSPAVRLDQLDGGGEPLRWNLGEPRGDLLVGRVVDPVAGRLPPARDPATTEAAVSVEDQQRLARGTHGEAALERLDD